MKRVLLFAALASLTLAEDPTKRGTQKASPLNAIAPNNPKPVEHHQKPEPQQPQQQTIYVQQPVYVPQHQQFGFVPHQPQQQGQVQPHQQIVPYPVFAQPKYQLVAMKALNGQMHLTLIPQSVFYGPHNYVQAYPVPSPMSPTGHPVVQPSFVPQPTVAQVQYVPQYQPYHPMFAAAPVAPAAYSPHHHHQQASSLAYSPAAQQLLHYYQTNPQAKHQLLYGGAAAAQQPSYHHPHHHQQQPSQQPSYQSVEYVEKPSVASGPVHQNYQQQQQHAQHQAPKLVQVENELNLNMNEYINHSAETQFRPITAFGTRTHPQQMSYKP